MNSFIKNQCQNMIQTTSIFEQSCKIAAVKDDGQISKDEEKALNQIQKASENFKKEISRIIAK